ncbi:MAG: hypothetical protein QOJ71_3313 [Actinomycetota bacterium]|nr:hypothetical protein [Actinomycetota bacterium]
MDNGIWAVFTPGADNGSPATGWTATCTSSDGGAPLSASTSDPYYHAIQVRPLTFAKHYTCTVHATNAQGDSDESAVSDSVLIVRVPDAPTHVTATSGNHQVSYAFDAPYDGGDPITDYVLNCGFFTAVIHSSSSPIVVTNLPNGVGIACRVEAHNTIGGGISPYVNGYPDTTPSAPAMNTVTHFGSGVKVAFTADTSNTFDIASNTATCTSSDGGTQGSATAFSSPVFVPFLTVGKIYTCSVHASNLLGDSPESGASGSTVMNVVPGAPLIDHVTIAGSQVSVAFFEGPNGGSIVTGFTAACTSSNGGASGSVSGSASPLVVTGLTNGATYVCQVHATNAEGDSPDSIASSAVVPDVVPAAPTIGAVSLIWDTTAVIPVDVPVVNDGTAIAAYWGTCISSNGGATRTSGNTLPPISVLSLTPGKTYTCTARVANGAGLGPASVPSNSFTTPRAPDAPTAVRAVANPTSAATGSLLVRFVPPAPNGGSAVYGYTATCASSDGGAVGRADTPAPATQITVGGLTSSKSYTCRVVAMGTGGPGAGSATSSPVIVGTPAAPTGVVARPTPTTTVFGSLVVTFGVGANNGGTITSQTASCASTNGGVNKSVARAGATAAPITVTGLTTGKLYTCTVRVKNVRGAGLPASATPVIVGAPTAPTGVKAARASAGTLWVTFTIGAGNGRPITSQIATCTSSNGGVTKSATHTGATAAAIIVKGLSAGKSYRCAVRSTNARGVGNSSTASPAVVA